MSLLLILLPLFAALLLLLTLLLALLPLLLLLTLLLALLPLLLSLLALPILLPWLLVLLSLFLPLLATLLLAFVRRWGLCLRQHEGRILLNGYWGSAGGLGYAKTGSTGQNGAGHQQTTELCHLSFLVE